MTHGINAPRDGRLHGADRAQARRRGSSIPCVGAVVSLLQGLRRRLQGLIPPYIVLTEPQGRSRKRASSVRATSRSPPAATGPGAFAGARASSRQGITDQRQRDRRDLLHELDTLGQRRCRATATLDAFAKAEDQAYDLILGDAGKVFDLSQEKDDVRERYGRNTFGQSCLVARRLVERGVPYVTINYKGWDTHKQHFQTMRQKLPRVRQGAGDAAAGPGGPRPARQHDRLVERRVRPHAEGAVGSRRGTAGAATGARRSRRVVAGGGFKGGQVVGATDATRRRGEGPARVARAT